MGYQSIYNRLRANELTEAGALALLGNWDCESNCESVRVQGDFSPYRTVSKQYVADVDSGRISRELFQKYAKGFGLAQWTYFTRKAALYDYARMKKASVGDEAMQVDFALLELRTDFSGLYQELKNSNDLYQCTNDVCYRYENPAIKNVQQRYNSAMRIREEININPGPDPEPGPNPEPVPAEVFWPPRVIDFHCVTWPEVKVLNAVLFCRGYLPETYDSLWTNSTTEAVISFQQDNGLDADGVVGNMTWSRLLEVKR